MKHRELSVIIPIYNVEAYLPQCLDSIVSQLGNGADERTEVILVDDGSTDRSGEIADHYADICPGVHVIHKKNAGVAAARNTGMGASVGGWLYFMDSDDWMAEEGVSLLLEAAAACPQADVILTDAWQNRGDNGQPWEHFEREDFWKRREEMQRLQRGVLYYPMDFPKTKVPLAAPWDKLYRREFLVNNQIRFREELRVLDDMIFNMEVFGKAQKAAYKKYKICHYRHVTDSITNCFRPDRVEQDSKVWRRIEAYCHEHFQNEKDTAENGLIWRRAFEQAYYGRIIRSFTICCRLCFYHGDNPKSYREKQEYVRSVALSVPYRQAFLRINTRNLEWKLQIVVFLMRHDLYGGLYLLHLMEQSVRQLRGG